MKTAKEVFLISRAHGLRAHLLKTPDLIRLAGTKGLMEMSDALLTSDYSSELSRFAAGDLTGLRLEKVFLDKLSRRWYSLLQTSSGGMKELLEAHNARFEVENLKKIIRAVHGETMITDDELIDIPRQYQKVNFPALLVTKKMPEVLELLRESPYRRVAERLEDYERYDNPVLLESELDRIYYGDLWTKTKKASDSRRIRALIGTEVDLRNLQAILTSKYTNLERRLLSETLVDLRYKLRKSVVSSLEDLDIAEMPRVPIWQGYSELLRRAVEVIEQDKTVDMEVLFSRHLYTYAEKVAIRNPNSIVYVFAYLQLCFREARNLTTLALGKQMKMSSEKIGNLLFL